MPFAERIGTQPRLRGEQPTAVNEQEHRDMKMACLQDT